jgi:hypothetical protein
MGGGKAEGMRKSGESHQDMRGHLGIFGSYGFMLEAKPEELVLWFYDELIETYPLETKIGVIVLRCREHLLKINGVEL